MTKGVRAYRGVGPDERQELRRARLTEAGLTVIGRVGIAATTVGAVCSEAGLTKRYFYESFADLDAMLVEVLDGLFRTVWDRIHAALASAPADLRSRAEVTVAQVVDVMGEDERLARLYVEAPGHPELHPRRQRAFHDYAGLWAGDVLGIDDPGPRELLGALLFISGTTEVLINWLEGTVDLARTELIDELVALGTAPVRSKGT